MKLGEMDFIYVIGQFLLFAAFFIDPGFFTFPSFLFFKILAGLFMAIGFVMGMGSLWQLRHYLSPFPSPRINTKLIQTQWFQYIRHPIYTAIIFAAIGVSLLTGSGYRMILSLLLILLFYKKSSYEELRLMEVFPEYRNYQKRTGRFLPRLFKSRK